MRAQMNARLAGTPARFPAGAQSSGSQAGQEDWPHAETSASATTASVTTFTTGFSPPTSPAPPRLQVPNTPISRLTELLSTPVPTTPIPGSPLTEEERILTPLVNKKARRAALKGKGKKRAVEPTDDDNNPANHSKKSKRGRH